MGLYTKLCALFERQGLHAQAAAYQRTAIDAAIKDGLPLKEYAKFYIALAQYEINLKDDDGRKTGDLVMAERYLSILLNSPGTLDVRYCIAEFPGAKLILLAGEGRSKVIDDASEGSTATRNRLK